MRKHNEPARRQMLEVVKSYIFDLVPFLSVDLWQVQLATGIFLGEKEGRRKNFLVLCSECAHVIFDEFFAGASLQDVGSNKFWNHWRCFCLFQFQNLGWFMSFPFGFFCLFSFFCVFLISLSQLRRRHRLWNPSLSLELLFFVLFWDV